MKSEEIVCPTEPTCFIDRATVEPPLSGHPLGTCMGPLNGGLS